MTEFYQRFVVPDIPQVIRTFVATIAEARAAGYVATVEHLTLSFGEMEAELAAVAAETAVVADEAIRERIHSTTKRAAQTQPGGLLDQIASEPIIGAAGIVGIARISGRLDSLPYWRAQEYGLDEQNFIGRVLHGFFFDFGYTNPTEPSPGYGDQPYFQSDPLGGAGVIQHPIEARHFLRDGAEVAAAFWTKETRRVAVETAAKIRVAL